LCRLLLSHPDILLLDEPTNHLDAASVEWLEKFLDDYRGLVIAITHDRYFLDSVAQYILELTEGRCLPFKGNYTVGDDSVVSCCKCFVRTGWKTRKNGLIANPSKTRRSMRLAGREVLHSRTTQVIKRELEWLRGGAKGNQKKVFKILEANVSQENFIF